MTATFALRRAAYHGATAQLLVSALGEDLHTRYGGEGIINDPDPAVFTAPSGTFLVAYLGTEPVACGGVRPFAHEGPEGGDRSQLAEVKRMFVHPAHRGFGLGRRLLAALETFAAQAGYRELWLETGTGQPEAMALYATTGYQPVPPYGDYKDAPGSRCYAKRLQH